MENESIESKNKKELTTAQKKRLDGFNKIRDGLLEQGYREKPLIITAVKANVMVLVTTAPISIICYILFFVIHRRQNINTKLGFGFWIVVLLAIVVHELIHGITWATFCKKKWKAIGFGVDWSTLTPYCFCNEGLRQKKYALGDAMPTIVLGVLPYITGLALGNYYLVAFGLVHTLAGGGDAYILWLIRKEKNAVLLDHPYLVGCVAFNKN